MDLHIRAAVGDDAERVAAIYNQGIEERAATFEMRPRGVEEIRAAIASDYPMLVAIDTDKAVLGWARLSAYRSRDCYAGIAEFRSIWILRRAAAVLASNCLPRSSRLRPRPRKVTGSLLSRVFTFNAASRALCRTCGFREVGIYEKHAKLDGAWLDVVIVEKLFPVNLT
jgi:L-amino acid N-acyltransferase YncA